MAAGRADAVPPQLCTVGAQMLWWELVFQPAPRFLFDISSSFLFFLFFFLKLSVRPASSFFYSSLPRLCFMNFLSPQPADAVHREELGTAAAQPAVQEEPEENSARLKTPMGVLVPALERTKLFFLLERCASFIYCPLYFPALFIQINNRVFFKCVTRPHDA